MEGLFLKGRVKRPGLTEASSEPGALLETASIRAGKSGKRGETAHGIFYRETDAPLPKHLEIPKLPRHFCRLSSTIHPRLAKIGLNQASY